MAKKTTKSSYHHGDLRLELIKQSKKIIESHGVESFSMRQVALNIGVDVAACYRHYEDKQDLLIAVAEDCFQDLGTLLGSCHIKTKKQDASKKIINLAQIFSKYAFENPNYFNLMFNYLKKDFRVKDHYRDHNTQLGPYQQLKKTISEWLEDEYRDQIMVDDIALSVWTAVHGLIHLALNNVLIKDLQKRQMDQLIAQQVNVVLTGYKYVKL
ncbi:MAG: TetR/AcrR family transcriptional regulator [Pseudobdellovibrio sp.]